MNVMKYDASCLALTFIGPQISEWINCNRYSALVPFPNDFLVDFPAKQHSQVDKSTFSMYSVLYLIIDQHQIHGSLIWNLI